MKTTLFGLLTLALPLAALAQQVGINTPAPTQMLDVNGTLRVQGLSGNGAGRLLTAGADGTLQVAGPLATPSTFADQAPVSVGRAATGQFPYGVVLNAAGTRAYVSNTTDNNLQVFDLSNPDQPVSLGTVSTGSSPEQLVLNAAGTRLYVALFNGGSVQIFDPSGPGLPVSLGAVGASGRPTGLALNAANTRLYVVTNNNPSLQVLDVSGPGQPVNLGTVPTATTSSSRVVLNPAGTRAYVLSDGALLLQVFDTSGPGLPVSLGTVYQGPESRLGLVSASGNRLYVAGYNSSGFQIFDASGPGLPTLLGGVSGVMPGIMGGTLNLSGTRAYTVGANRLQTFEVSGSGAALLGSVPTNYVATAVAPHPNGSRLYVTNYNNGNVPGGVGSLQVFAIGLPRLLAVGATGALTSVAPSSLPGDNLGNHTATQNLYLGGYALVGGRAVGGTTFTASAGVSTPALLAPATGGHPLLPAAYGTVGSSGSLVAGTGNYTVSRTSAGVYRLTFGDLGSANLGNAAVRATLAGAAPGTLSYNGGAGYLTMYTFDPGGAAADRSFSFSLTLP